MKYITNTALREWVKEDLRISIFQMAHKLATQTGCELLVKLQDSVDHSGCQYYATRTLNLQYIDKGLSKQPWEVMVSGISGLPVASHGVQSESVIQNGSVRLRENSSEFARTEHSVGVDGQATESLSFTNNLISSIANNTKSMNQIKGDDGEIPGTIIKLERRDSQDTIPAEDSWTDNVALPFPVAIESALGDQGGGSIGHANDENHSRIVEELQQQIYLYANTNTAGNGEELDEEREEEEDEDEEADSEHRRRTPPALNYKCTLCQKRCSSVPLLVRHAKSFHPGDENMRYHCVLCDREYKHARHLLQHTDLHSKASYRCSTCCKGFYRSSTLREHELRDHQGRYRHYCPKCHKGFMRPSTMQTHLNRAHPSWLTSKSRPNPTRKRSSATQNRAPRPIFPAIQAEQSAEVHDSQGQGPSTSIEPTQIEDQNSVTAVQTVQNSSYVQTVVVAANAIEQTQKKPQVVYQCKTCGKIYEMANSLVRHIRDRHRKIKMRCNFCRYRTSRSADLARHKRAIHPMQATSTMTTTAPGKESQ